MQHLKILEHTPHTLFFFLVLGTIFTLVVLYFLFTSNWTLAIIAAILVDVFVLTLHNYTSNLEPKIVEINEKGIVTNTEVIRYKDIDLVEEKHVEQGSEQLHYLVIKAGGKNHEFYTNEYKNSSQEIVNCIHKNLSVARK